MHLARLAQGGLDAVTCRLAGQGGCAGGISRLAAVANQGRLDASLPQVRLPAAHQVSALHPIASAYLPTAGSIQACPAPNCIWVPAIAWLN